MTTNPKLTVLVTGATGHQGGALARTLLEKGHRVRAFTRKPDSPAAQQLKQRGAEIAVGSLEDRTSLEPAMRGADAVFLMGTPFEAGEVAEVRQGKVGVDAAKAAGVKHLVYTSVGSADRSTGIPHFDSKYEIELYLRASGVPHTILAPVWFMENFISPWFLPALKDGKLAMPLPPTRSLQMIALENIGRLAALAIEQPDAFLGKRIDLASDEVTVPQVADTISRLSGQSVQYVEQPIEQVRAFSEDFALMYEWFNRVGYSVDLAGLRKDFPEAGWHSFEDWAKAQGWKSLLGAKPEAKRTAS
jgi:uncharacterized protein YbjT (DUF2867 family)